ncbi:mammalian ependymin-related protein 1 [Lingula anatina]|uniref:Mammalian ependymin-related protein 1 n=1 Tax=Lingula anatina TaxID=7574 RepID=A0A1S3I8V8_LINAN|nr:mammalian ependymin-related protein 1 [Lingula anatina]|eukprot:XP_013393824.1 mammalian ependymin-related protein 1 [Lingula anatina]
MLLVAVCLGILAVAAADKKPCCAPPQWEGLLAEKMGTDHQGKAWLLQEGALMSVSWPDKKINFMGQVNATGGTSVKFRVIQDYKAKQQYAIVHKNCTKTALAEEMINGVPPNATYVGTFYLGAGKDNELMFDTWLIKYKGMDFQSELATTVKDCIPMSWFAFGTVNKDKLIQSAGIVNVTLGIKDNSVFTVPDICKKASNEYPHPVLAGMADQFRLRL